MALNKSAVVRYHLTKSLITIPLLIKYTKYACKEKYSKIIPLENLVRTFHFLDKYYLGIFRGDIEHLLKKCINLIMKTFTIFAKEYFAIVKRILYIFIHPIVLDIPTDIPKPTPKKYIKKSYFIH